MINCWRIWIDAFDLCVADDKWDRLHGFLTDDVVYAVQGTPFSCELRGRDQVIRGFAKSIQNFDRKFDERKWVGVGIREWGPSAISGRALGYYRLGDNPPITFSAQSQWIFRGNQLSIMTDIYDVAEADNIAALTALAAFGDGFDPSYA